MLSSRKEALILLQKWFYSDAYIDHLLDQVTTSLSAQDRRFRDALVHLTIQWKRQTDAILSQFLKSSKKPPKEIYLLLLLGATELLHMDGTRDYGTVNSFVSLARFHKKFVNAILRNVIRFRDSGAFDQFFTNSAIPLGVRYSFPDWMVDRWKSQFGHDVERLLQALNQPPLRMIRLIDESKREDVIDILTSMNIWEGIYPDREDFFCVKSLQPLLNHDIFTSGVVTIQDVSSTLVEYFFPEGGIHLACDVCSGPGGKTVSLLKHVVPGGKVYAYDIDLLRLNQVRETLNRLKFSQVELHQADARSATYPKADLFLIDAPCSGFGVIRKRSDLRWRRKPEDITLLQNLQTEILENVSRSVPPGGSIIYSTCTFDKAENNDMIERFLKNHPDFHWVEPSGKAPKAWRDATLPILQTLPQNHRCEGSFAGRVKRL
ncbi:MAG: transcription antitermination factor NusB [Candidatus Marinimicrobia bacterium]|nr:transcription antitermination factor NusB [Candidatus Neomarinimicrobiota bacterium]